MAAYESAAMHLANPYALAWLVLAIPLVAFYLLRVRPRQQPVSTISFWQHVMPDSRPRRWWQRLRHPLSLIVQLLLLALLALALAEPQWNDQQTKRVLLVVLDNSASMQATDAVPDRFSVAKQHVRRLIDQMGPNDQMAVIRAGTTASLCCGLSSHKRSLRQIVAEIAVTDGPSKLISAIGIARSLPTEDADAMLLVVTDPGGRSEVEGDRITVPVQWIVCGGTAENVAITQFQVRRQTLDPIGFECLVEVTNYRAESTQLRLQIELNGQLQDVIPLDLMPQQSLVKVLSYVSAEGGKLQAAIDGSDALAVDDHAVAWLTPRLPRRVNLISPGDWYLQHALSALPLVELTVTPQAPTRLVNDSVFIFHNVEIASLPAGRSMVTQPKQSNDLWQLGDRLSGAVLDRQQPRSALLTHVQLNDMPAVGARRMQLKGSADVLAVTEEGDPIYAIVPHDRGETLVLNLDLQRGDFAWRTAFPILMSNAVNWLVDQRASLQTAYATGETVRLDDYSEMSVRQSSGTGDQDADAKQTVWVAETPDGSVREIGGQGRQAVLGPLDQVGIWTLRPRGPGDPSDARQRRSHLACNLVNRSESDLQSSVVESTAAVSLGPAGYPPWIYLVAAALVFLALEWWLYQRRWVS